MITLKTKVNGNTVHADGVYNMNYDEMTGIQAGELAIKVYTEIVDKVKRNPDMTFVVETPQFNEATKDFFRKYVLSTVKDEYNDERVINAKIIFEDSVNLEKLEERDSENVNNTSIIEEVFGTKKLNATQKRIILLACRGSEAYKKCCFGREYSSDEEPFKKLIHEIIREYHKFEDIHCYNDYYEEFEGIIRQVKEETRKVYSYVLKMNNERYRAFVNKILVEDFYGFFRESMIEFDIEYAEKFGIEYNPIDVFMHRFINGNGND